MNLVSAVLCCSLLFSALPARADWQFTRWGMTEEEVLAAAPPSMKLQKVDATLQKFLGGKYTAGKYQFTARLWFNAEGLYEVELEREDGGTPETFTSCFDLDDDLKVTYGEPKRSGEAMQGHFLLINQEYIQWRDEVKNNLVWLFTSRVSDSCVIVYRPVPIPTTPQKIDGL